MTKAAAAIMLINAVVQDYRACLLLVLFSLRGGAVGVQAGYLVRPRVRPARQIACGSLQS